MKHLFQLIIISIFSIASISGQEIDQAFFDQAHSFFSKEVSNGLLDYAELKNNKSLKSLISHIENADLSTADMDTKKAFYINAYNLHVISAAAKAFPINSVMDLNGFFDNRKITIAGEHMTLNALEKNQLLKVYNDARLHFVLVCGAIGCPPITNFAYRPSLVEKQLEQQTKIALNNPKFLKISADKTELSQIFNWYANDFGSNKAAIIEFINAYRTNAISNDSKISYYPYNWDLNDASNSSSEIIPNVSGANNASRYIVSSTIPKGSSEVKIFNNLYSQQTGNAEQLTDRSTFFTTSVSYLYGLNNRFNIGLNTRYRRVRNSSLPDSPFAVLGSSESSSARQGLTALGPQIRYAPVEKWTNFSIQSSFVFPIGQDLAGNDAQPYIDWNGATWNTQFFNDFSIGRQFSLFTEIDLLWEDIGGVEGGHANRVSTPATLILSYNPTPKATIYTIGGFSPYWQSTFDYFIQGGVGAKYQFNPNFELELLVTEFSNKFLKQSGGQAATYNVGLRYNIQKRTK